MNNGNEARLTFDGAACPLGISAVSFKVSIIYLLTHLLTYSLTHSLTHSLTYLLTYLLFVQVFDEGARDG